MKGGVQTFFMSVVRWVRIEVVGRVLHLAFSISRWWALAWSSEKTIIVRVARLCVDILRGIPRIISSLVNELVKILILMGVAAALIALFGLWPDFVSLVHGVFGGINDVANGLTIAIREPMQGIADGFGALCGVSELGSIAHAMCNVQSKIEAAEPKTETTDERFGFLSGFYVEPCDGFSTPAGYGIAFVQYLAHVYLGMDDPSTSPGMSIASHVITGAVALAVVVVIGALPHAMRRPRMIEVVAGGVMADALLFGANPTRGQGLDFHPQNSKKMSHFRARITNVELRSKRIATVIGLLLAAGAAAAYFVFAFSYDLGKYILFLAPSSPDRYSFWQCYTLYIGQGITLIIYIIIAYSIVHAFREAIGDAIVVTYHVLRLTIGLIAWPLLCTIYEMIVETFVVVVEVIIWAFKLCRCRRGLKAKNYAGGAALLAADTNRQRAAPPGGENSASKAAGARGTPPHRSEVSTAVRNALSLAAGTLSKVPRLLGWVLSCGCCTKKGRSKLLGSAPRPKGGVEEKVPSPHAYGGPLPSQHKRHPVRQRTAGHTPPSSSKGGHNSHS